MIALVLLAGLLGSPAPAMRAASIVQTHPIATECAVDDQACLATHDAWTIAYAAYAQDVRVCDRAVNLAGCLDAVFEAFEPARDPCVWIAKIENGWATLVKNGRSIVRRAEKDWRAGAFTGRCVKEIVDPFED